MLVLLWGGNRFSVVGVFLYGGIGCLLLKLIGIGLECEFGCKFMYYVWLFVSEIFCFFWIIFVVIKFIFD